MLTRRALIATTLLLAIPPPVTAKRERRHRRPPPPTPLTVSWPVTAAPRVIPVQCGAGAEWLGPVRAAADAWNRAQSWLRLDVREIAAPPDGALPDPGTILVTAARRGAWWGGYTETVPGDDGLVGARITFDTADSWPDDRARTLTAAHELGHALGLPHAPARDPGCMAPGPDHDPAPRPSDWTLGQLALTYGGDLPRKRRRRGHR